MEESRYLERLIKLIEKTGGEVEDSFFVLKPGCSIIAKTEVTPTGEELFRLMNIDLARAGYEQLAEFTGRMTYLAFPEQPKDSREYNRRMTEEHQHLSVISSYSVTFVLAGIAIETSHELCAHGEAKVGRLTSSKTKAMDRTLYRVLGTDEEVASQKKFIREFMSFKYGSESEAKVRNGSRGTEFANMLNVGMKATALNYTMNLKDYHKLFIGRLGEQGNETDLQIICSMMCEQLHERFPAMIKTVSEYYAMNNGEKYKV